MAKADVSFNQQKRTKKPLKKEGGVENMVCESQIGLKVSEP